MDQLTHGQPAHVSLTHSEVRRWRAARPGSAPDVESVRHGRLGQEWAPHWHDEWSFGAVVRGRCRFSLGGQLHEVRAGDLLCIAPHTVHTGALGQCGGALGALTVMTYCTAQALPPDLRGELASLGNRRVRQPSLVCLAADLDSRQHLTDWLAQAVRALSVGEHLHALPHAASELASPQTQRILADFHRAVLANGGLDIVGLAKQCSVGREHLHRVLKRWVGLSPQQYQRVLRINLARAMLADGHSASDTAAASGFADQARMVRWFRRVLGYTPGALSRAVRGAQRAG